MSPSTLRMRIRTEIPHGVSKECFRMLKELMQSSFVLPLAVQSPSVGSPTVMKTLPRHFQMKKPTPKVANAGRRREKSFSAMSMGWNNSKCLSITSASAAKEEGTHH